MKMVKPREVCFTFLDAVHKALDEGFNVVAVQAEEIMPGTGRFLIHGLNENGDSVAVLEEQHDGKTADEVEAQWAAEVGNFIEFRETMERVFEGATWPNVKADESEGSKTTT
jgi:hypothetical protein